MNTKPLEKVFTVLVFLNLLIYLCFFILGKSPESFDDRLMFFFPIIFSVYALILFSIDYFKNKQPNWYWFFIITIAFLPAIIFAIASDYRPWRNPIWGILFFVFVLPLFFAAFRIAKKNRRALILDLPISFAIAFLYEGISNHYTNIFIDENAPPPSQLLIILFYPSFKLRGVIGGGTSDIGWIYDFLAFFIFWSISYLLVRGVRYIFSSTRALK